MLAADATLYSNQNVQIVLFRSAKQYSRFYDQVLRSPIANTLSFGAMNVGDAEWNSELRICRKWTSWKALFYFVAPVSSSAVFWN